MKINTELLTWGLDIKFSSLDPEEAIEDGENKLAIETAVRLTISSGDVWGWCDLEVTCHLAGCDFLKGISTYQAQHYQGEQDFLTSSSYREMRSEAQADLEKKLDLLLATMSSTVPDLLVIPHFEVGDRVISRVVDCGVGTADFIGESGFVSVRWDNGEYTIELAHVLALEATQSKLTTQEEESANGGS